MVGMTDLLAWFRALRQVFVQPELQAALPSLSVRRAWRLRLRLCCHPQSSMRWLACLRQETALHARMRQSPGLTYRLLQKPLRPYLNYAYSPAQRLTALVSHYQQRQDIPALATEAARQQLLSGWFLAEFVGKSGAHYVLRLSHTDRFDREGELLLTLAQHCTGQRIAIIAFSLNNQSGRGLDIGCLQGAAQQAGAGFIRTVTRDFHGMRPKNLLMFALYDLAACWQIERIRAIDNVHRIYHRVRRLFPWSHALSADYDHFWQELGGEPCPHETGWFLLPSHLHQRSVEETPSKHRAEHRRRLALRDAVDTQIRQALMASVPPAAPDFPS